MRAYDLKSLTGTPFSCFPVFCPLHETQLAYVLSSYTFAGQQPVQKLFTEKLGLPLRMTPNYEDMSCQMSFGVHPLPIEEDPAITGDCLSDCKMSGTYKRQSKGGDNCYVDSPNKPKKQALVGDNSKNTFAK